MDRKIGYVEVDEEPLHQEIFRNREFRVYRAVLKPGVATDYHRHSKNTVYAALQGGRITTEKMKGTPACPTVLSKSLSLSKRLKLIVQKIFQNSIEIENGFVFYMPSRDFPVIHRAVASVSNSRNMELLGIEILCSNSPVKGDKECSGKIEIETDEIRISRLVIKTENGLDGGDIYGKGVILVLSGTLEVRANGNSKSKNTGDIVEIDWPFSGGIENTGEQDAELLYISGK